MTREELLEKVKGKLGGTKLTLSEKTVNEELDDTPEAINDDAYDAWIVEVRLDDTAELDSLLGAEDYEACCTEE